MTELKEKYFTCPEDVIHLKKGDVLFQKGETNRRLFYVEYGEVKSYDPDEKDEFFIIQNSNFAGLNSFFSNCGLCRMSVVATEDSKLLYIEKELFSDDNNEANRQLAYDFMPLVVDQLYIRQEIIYQTGIEHQKVLEKMNEVERLASLGQLSAGVAHELNNAITVIARGSELVSSSILKSFNNTELETEMINLGISKGRVVSSAEARKNARKLSKSSSLSEDVIRDCARTGIAEKLIKEEQAVAQRASDLWNLGATLYDLQLAVSQSEHVVSSMRSMASSNILRQLDCDVNESIQKALSLLKNAVKSANMDLQLNDVPMINANVGELVQIWSNIIKNAIDAMEDMPLEERNLLVKSEREGAKVKVSITDTGHGIPEDMREEIFKPHVTTKQSGQTFGLGLGLAIVQKIINSNDGDLKLESSPAGTTFTIYLPTA